MAGAAFARLTAPVDISRPQPPAARRRCRLVLSSMSSSGAAPPPTVLVVMGVSGCGKSTVGALLADRLGCPFYEGDSFHPPSNVAKMKAGTPLVDEDRWPWLEKLAGILQRHVAERQPAVLSCSALRPAYRRLLHTGRRDSSSSDGADGSSSGATLGESGSGCDVGFVLLEPPTAVLEARLRKRAAAGEHFMPASLLASQLGTLQYHPAELYLHIAGEAALRPAEANVEAILARMQRQERRQQ